MTAIGWIQILLYCAIIVAITPVLGGYMTRVFNGERTFLSPVLRPVEAAIYWAGGVDEKREQSWLTIRDRHAAVPCRRLSHPLRRDARTGRAAVQPGRTDRRWRRISSFNTAISFITNTNWQNYGGEGTMSYLTQMLGLTHQNFLSAATGIVLALVLIRGFARASMKTVGNFWVDITRCTLYILMPICVVAALFLVWQGMPQTLGPYVDATTLEGAKQTIAVGPVASQIAIKMLGTNGGGFFNANASHPFENPTALSNYRADHFDLRARRFAHQCVRPHGRQPAPGLGRPRRHGRAVHRRRDRLLLGRSQRHDRAQRARAQPAATWKARKSASASSPRRCSR